MNGNSDTVAEMGKTKVSMFGQAMTPGRVSKISKFSRSGWFYYFNIYFYPSKNWWSQSLVFNVLHYVN